MRRNHIHQIRTQTIITLQSNLPKPAPNTPHPLSRKPLLDNTAHESRELRFLPAIPLGAELGVDEIQPLESVVGFDPPEHVRAAVLARVALDHGRRVHDVEFVPVGGYAQLVAGYDADEGEEGSRGFPAFGAAACFYC